MSDAERIEIEVDGVDVIGVVTVRMPRLIEVKLVKPYGILSSSMSVPVFAASHADLTGPQGDEAAVGMLRMLFTKARRFYEHRQELRSLWDETQRQLDELERVDRDRPAVLAGLKRNARADFRTGLLDQASYQRALKTLRSRAASFESRQSAIIDAYMELRLWPERGIDMGQSVAFIEALNDDDAMKASG